MRTLKSLFLKYRSPLITIFSIILIGVAVLCIYYSLAVRVTSNDECLWEPKTVSKDSIAIFFDLVKVDGVTWNAGIRDGDQLLEIGGKPLQNTVQATIIFNSFKSGEYAEYKYARDGEVFTTKVYVKKLISFEWLASSISALFWILIGFIVLSAKPDGKVQKIFYTLAVLIVLSSMTVLIPFQTNFFGFFKESTFLASLIGISWIIGLCFTPFTLIYFFWIFPKPFQFVAKRWIRRVMFIIPGILTIALTLLAILTINFGMVYYSIFYSALENFRYFSMAGNLTAFVFLIIQYRRLKTKAEKKPLMLFIIAFIFTIVIPVYIGRIAPAISDTIFNSPEYYTPIILIVIVPLIFAYSIFKYQLMDVSVVVKNTIIYGTATVTVAAIYFFVIYVAGQSISSFFGVENQGIIAGIFFIIFALVFQSSKNRFQDFLTKRFYPEQFASQKVLIDLSNELSTVVGLDNILQLMKKTFVDALKIKTFGIMMRDKDGNLALVDSVGMNNDKCLITESRIIQFLKDKYLITKYPSIEQSDYKVVFPDDKAERLVSEGVYTIIPMLVKSKIVGLLLFGLKHSGSHFAGKDLELLWAAANQAAISIENARLYKSEVEKQKIERDLDLARKIQQGLLPQCIPDMSGLDICGEMIPAMQVGGDYFDLIQVSYSKLFVVVGDVSGKGLSASLYMTKLQTMIKLSCMDNKSPKEILVDINKRIYDELDRNWFVTITLALFDMETNKLTFCRAGHMPVLQATNGTVQAYRTQGLGVGMEKGIVFEKSLLEEVVNIASGQTYAFFTDGVTEAMNERNEFFGDDNLNSILKNKTNSRSAEIVNEIWSSIKSFRGTAEVNDDMTMVVVKVK
ncbi:MAG: SpoIIE family protein phosphatase [Ignavibacteriaceae bacterium]|nr:SpoIIE family protein phosphatase [Ignavibacteriaceae bacterium]